MACGRSKEALFYVLNPLPPLKDSKPSYKGLLIGIDEVSIPGYVERPQLMIHYTPYRMKLEEYHQWAEALGKNITRVVETDLSTLLPGAIVESSPWTIAFRPNYHLQMEISQLDIDIYGNSSLRGEYLIYQEEKLIKKRDIYYHRKIPLVNIETLVSSVNANLSCLTQDIAHAFIGVLTK
jgi:uncharacterized lipoprotein YmbA